MGMSNLNFDEVESACDDEWARLKIVCSDSFYTFFTEWVKKPNSQKALREFANKIRNEDDGIYGTVQTMNVKIIKGVQYGPAEE